MNSMEVDDLFQNEIDASKEGNGIQNDWPEGLLEKWTNSAQNIAHNRARYSISDEQEKETEEREWLAWKEIIGEQNYPPNFLPERRDVKLRAGTLQEEELSNNSQSVLSGLKLKGVQITSKKLSDKK